MCPTVQQRGQEPGRAVWRGTWVIVEKLMHRKWQRVLVVRLEEVVCSVTDCLAAIPIGTWLVVAGRPFSLP